MKINIIPAFGAILASMLLLTACEKNQFALKENVFVTGKARLKVNFASSYGANPLYQVNIDGIRVSNGLTFFTPFPGGGLNTGGSNYADYLAAEPGMRKITISRPFLGTAKDSVELASATVDLTADKIYSLYFVDTAANTTSVLVEDILNSPDSGFAKFRFINLMPDMPTADLYFGTGTTAATSTKVAGPIAYKGVSDYFTIPITTGTVWSVRPGGAASSTTADTSYTSASTLTNQRIYTVVTRGYRLVRAAADVRKRNVSFIYNR
ncbi:MAG: DUF4397 domain-containing protein [Bacteroidota bacterium]